jgi:hypothetical protein
MGRKSRFKADFSDCHGGPQKKLLAGHYLPTPGLVNSVVPSNLDKSIARRKLPYRGSHRIVCSDCMYGISVPHYLRFSCCCLRWGDTLQKDDAGL